METGDRAHRRNVVVNILLTGSKVVVGWMAGSPALLADGVHSFSDVLTNAGAWVGYLLAQPPPDDNHPYGHGNAEAVVALVFGLIMIGTGVATMIYAWSSGDRAEASPFGVAAVLVALGASGTKVWLWWVTRRDADALNSPSLRAVARDHITDAFTALVVLAGIVGSLFGLEWPEPVAATLVAVFVLYMGGSTAKEGFDVLMDRVDPELRDEMIAVARGVEGVQSASSLRVHPMGASMYVDLEIAVDGELTVHEGHEIAHRVEDALMERWTEIEQALVHVNPASVQE